MKKITIGLIWMSLIILSGCSYHTDSEIQYNKISFCKDKGYNYHEVVVREETIQQSTGVSTTRLITDIECDWFSPLKEPNKKELYNYISKYCEDIGSDPMGTNFDCTKLYDEVYLQI